MSINVPNNVSNFLRLKLLESKWILLKSSKFELRILITKIWFNNPVVKVGQPIFWLSNEDFFPNFKKRLIFFVQNFEKKVQISVVNHRLNFILKFQEEAKAKLGQAQVGRRPTKQVHGTLPTTLTKTIPISSALPVTQNQQIIINSDGSATNAVPISGSISIPVSQEKVL